MILKKKNNKLSIDLGTIIVFLCLEILLLEKFFNIY